MYRYVIKELTTNVVVSKHITKFGAIRHMRRLHRIYPELELEIAL